MSEQTKELTASEAVYGFAAWLTARDEDITIGATENCSPVAYLVERFIEANNLKQPGNKWADILKYPAEVDKEL